ISEGCALGYRRGSKGGTWIARFRDEAGKQHYKALGAADDARDPDGRSVFSFAQAQERARGWFDRKVREQAGDLVPLNRPYTVADALADYRSTYVAGTTKGGGKAVDRLDASAAAWIIPELGPVGLDKLTRKRISDWHQNIAGTPARLRT